MKVSTKPPMKPAARPNTTPRATLIAVASTPTTREILAPYRILIKRSRPLLSVPSQNVLLGGTGPPLAFSPISMNCWLGP